MTEEQTTEFSKLFDIYEINGYTRTRLGIGTDCGYVVPAELLREVRSCVTYGVGWDVSFEKQLDDMFPENQIGFDFYDPTVQGLPGNPPRNARFFKKYVDGVNAGADRVSPDETLAGKKSVLLKFDVEEAEYGFTNRISDAFLDEVLMVVFEIHWLHRNSEKAYGLLKFLNRRFATFHLHGNNNDQLYVDVGEKKVPDVCEFTMVNRALITGMFKSASAFPVPGLDFKNNPANPELILNWTQAGS